MASFRPIPPWLALLPFLLLPRLTPAQELSFLAGRVEAVDIDETASAWQADFRYNFLSNFALSASWINEGHVTGHHRDGFATQFWGRVPLPVRRLSLGFGAGAHHYFDTKARPGGDHANVHGWGPIYSLSATYDTGTPWYARAMINHIHPAGEFNSNMYLVGIGYRLWKEPVDRAGAAPGAAEPSRTTTDREAMVFLGQTVHNSFDHARGPAGGLEYRQGISDHLDWTVTAMAEDNAETIRRAGLATQLWLVDAYIDRRIALGFGAGVYSFLDRKPPPGNAESRSLDFAGIVSLTTSYRFADRWFTRFNWNRVVSDDDRDSDMFVLGLGRRWGE